jgi:hypothetical protein
VCGDGLCQSPEHAASCPVDCGELLRNPKLLGTEGVEPYHWRGDVQGMTYQQVDQSKDVPTGQVLVLRQAGVEVSQPVAVLAGQTYTLAIRRSPAECLEAFVFTNDQVYAHLQPGTATGTEEGEVGTTVGYMCSLSRISGCFC